MVLGIDIYKKKKFREVTDIVCVREREMQRVLSWKEEEKDRWSVEIFWRNVYFYRLGVWAEILNLDPVENGLNRVERDRMESFAHRMRKFFGIRRVVNWLLSVFIIISIILPIFQTFHYS